MKKQVKQKRLILLLLILSGIVVSFLSLIYGRYSVSAHEVLKVIFNYDIENLSRTSVLVIQKIRIPRILAALFIGSAFSVAGAAYQSIFMNPLVSPNLLGVTSGAGFGASLAILLGFSNFGIQTTAFLFGLATVALTYAISYSVGKIMGRGVVVIILSGMVIGALFNSFISITKFLADPNDTLPEITFWLMGTLAGITMADFTKILIPISIGLVALLGLRWKLNLMSLGEDEAKSIGVNTKLIRGLTVVFSTLIISASVSVCGIIGWIGIVIPHISRMLIGVDNRYLIPVSLVTGGIYLLIIDTIARTVLPVEIPLSILTSIIGAPFFIYLMFTKKGGWS